MLQLTSPPFNETRIREAICAHYYLNPTSASPGRWLRQRLYCFGSYYAKFLAPGTDASRLELQCEAWEMANQKRAILSLATPVRRRDGAFATWIEGWAFVVTAQVEGRRPCFDAELSVIQAKEDAAKLGTASAILELAFDEVANNPALTALRIRQMPPYDGLPNMIVPHQFYAAMRRHAWSSDLACQFDATIAKGFARLLERSNEASDATLLHGDLHSGNMLLHDNSVTIVDFETTHFGLRGFDFVYLLWTSAQMMNAQAQEILVPMARAYLDTKGGRHIHASQAERLCIWCWIQELWLLSERVDPPMPNMEVLLRAAEQSLASMVKAGVLE